MKRFLCRTVLSIAAVLALGACSGPGSAAPPAAPSPAAPAPHAPPTPPATRAPADAASTDRAELVRLIGAASCRADSDCRVLPIGSKACGGPEAYLAWSTLATDARQLDAAAARYKQAREERNRREGIMSDCAVTPEPPVRCVAATAGVAERQCRALAAGAGAGLR